MRPKSIRRFLLRWALPVVAGLVVLSGTPAAAAGLRLDPDSVSIGAFFDGTTVRVSGEIPAGSRAIVEVIGKRVEEQLMRKGHHWDIWMSVGEIDIEEAPRLYFVLSTDPAELSEPRADPEFGYAALAKRAWFSGDVEGMEPSEIFRRFVALKEEEELYRQRPGELRTTGRSGDVVAVEGSFEIPSRVAPGEYLVRLSVVDRGRVVRSETARLDVRMTGLPAFLTSLVREHGALHGLLAIAVAVVVGFLVGQAFKRRRFRRGDRCG